MPQDNRTERGTARARSKALEHGRMPRSRVLTSGLAVLAVVFVLSFEAASWRSQWLSLYRGMLGQALASPNFNAPQMARWTGLVMIGWAGPALAAAWLVSLVALNLQGGFRFNPQALFRPERLKPHFSSAMIFSTAGLERVGQSLIPGSAVIYICAGLIIAGWGHIIDLCTGSVPASMNWLFGMLHTIAWKTGMVMAIWGVGDYFWQRWSFERSIRMTKQEVKQEAKDTQGNPEILGRVRRTMRQAHKERLAKAVPRATVVITNPTHYAVALEYRPGEMPAPVVVAKGRNLLAQEIRRLARWHDIPVVENVPLARALYRTVEVGQQIPQQLYAAVAEILAFIFRTYYHLQPQAAGAGAPSR